jgi:hypothetical protein
MMKYAAAFGLALVTASPAMADTAILGWTGGSSFPAYSSDETVGFNFTANEAISITSLGIWNADGTIDAPHEVGLWDSFGTLLTSVVVGPQSSAAGTFVYADTSGITLTVGSSYAIGARYLIGGTDNYISSASSVSVDPAITFLGANRSPDSAGFAFPSIFDGTNGRFGPNFTFDVGVAAVPEPASWAMMLAGFGAVGYAMRRRKVSYRYAQAV